MNTRQDTTCIDINDANFVSAGMRLTWNVNGERRWSQVYTPSREAIEWDGADASTNYAVGSVHGFFVYVTVESTKDDSLHYVPNSGNEYGRKVKLTFNKGTTDEHTCQAYFVKNK